MRITLGKFTDSFNLLFLLPIPLAFYSFGEKLNLEPLKYISLITVSTAFVIFIKNKDYYHSFLASVVLFFIFLGVFA